MVLSSGALATLLALGLALGARGRIIAWAALGAWAGMLVGPSISTPFDPNRPVLALVETTGFPVTDDTFGAGRVTVWARVRAVEQARKLHRWRASALISLPAEAGQYGPGARLRVRGFLRRSVSPNNGTARRPGTWRLRIESPRFMDVLRPSPAWRQPWIRCRMAVEACLLGQEGQGPALIRTLVLGDSSALAEPLLIGLRRAGLAHVTAVSGLHVGLLTAGILWLSSRLGRLPRLVLGATFVLGYVGIAGMPVSALRAAGMTLLVLLALGTERPPTPRNALAITIIILTLGSPEMLQRFGFQLSVVATGAILVFGPAFAARMSWLPRSIRMGLAATLAAQVATLPLIVPRFAIVSPMAPLLNLLMAPWLVLTLMVVGIWTWLALTLPATAQRALPLIEHLLLPVTWLAEVPASPYWTWVVSPSWGWTVGLLVLVASWGFRWRPGTALVLATILLALPHAPMRPDPFLGVLDVGQGDAVLVRDGTRSVLIDGGGWPRGDIAGSVLVPALAKLGVRRLDALVLTHPDLDHCAGLVSVARYLPARSILMAPGWSDDDPCVQGLQQVPGVPVQLMYAGDQRRVGRWRLEVVHPSPADLRRDSLSRNDRSLVIRASVHERRFLLTGDLEQMGERMALGRPRDVLRADVLKLAHHGSASSSGRPFLAAVRPRLAIASAGRKNRFGHPAKVVRERLVTLGIPLLRTDLGGAVHIEIAANGALEITRPPW